MGKGVSVSWDPDESAPFRDGKDIELGFEVNGRYGLINAQYDFSIKAGGCDGNNYDITHGLKTEVSLSMEQHYPDFGTYGFEMRGGIKGHGFDSIDSSFSGVGKRSYGLGEFLFGGGKVNFWW